MRSASLTRAQLAAAAQESAQERARVASGRLPERYAEPWFGAFAERIEPALRPGVAVLDVGSGRTPAITAAERPLGCRYVGLDVSARELGLAPGGSYDEQICADIAAPNPDLLGEFDLIVSWQVLEHVKPLPTAFELMRAYLRPGGRMIAQLSGGLSAFALASRFVPHAVSKRLVASLLHVPPDQMFPAYYDRCRFSALTRMLGSFSDYEIVPRYKGARYFRFARTIEAAYLRYEDWIWRHDWRELATHYLIEAVR